MTKDFWIEPLCETCYNFSRENKIEELKKRWKRERVKFYYYERCPKCHSKINIEEDIILGYYCFSEETEHLRLTDKYSCIRCNWEYSAHPRSEYNKNEIKRIIEKIHGSNRRVR